MSARRQASSFSETEIAEVKRRAGLVETIGRVVALKREGAEHKGLCPFHTERTPSFTVNPAKGFYHCFGCGAHGDAINFVMATEGVDFPAAVKQLAAASGSQPSKNPKNGAPTPEEKARRLNLEKEKRRAAMRKESTVALAREIWGHSLSLLGDASPPVMYLHSRGIYRGRLSGNAWPASLRFLNNLKYTDEKNPERDETFHPCMIAAVQHYDPDIGKSTIRGIHRTYLRLVKTTYVKAFGKDSKKMLGDCKGGAIRFGPAASTLALAEGIETALSAVVGGIKCPVWAAGDLGKMAQVVLPPAVREVILLTDSDTAGAGKEKMLARAAEHYGRAGVRLREMPAPAGMDWNDVLCAERAEGK